MHILSIKCDCCEKTYPDDSAYVSVKVRAVSPSVTWDEEEYDVCPECLERIRDFYKAFHKDFFGG